MLTRGFFPIYIYIYRYNHSKLFDLFLLISSLRVNAKQSFNDMVNPKNGEIMQQFLIADGTVLLDSCKKI